MCLLVVASRVDPLGPLVVAANRDERLDRPAVAATTLRPQGPRIIGGRDEEAGGTWLAVNEHGVVAGLTNRPSRDGRDPSKRSRGELPLALAGHADASRAVEEFARTYHPRDYNPSWLLVGDRQSLFYIDMTGDDHPEVTALDPGIHVLENNPMGAGSPKARHVRGLLDHYGIEDGLRSVLADHSLPVDRGDLPDDVDPAVLAACVHTDLYGTRSAAVIRVPSDIGRAPDVVVADGHPCTAPFSDAGHLWSR